MSRGDLQAGRADDHRERAHHGVSLTELIEQDWGNRFGVRVYQDDVRRADCNWYEGVAAGVVAERARPASPCGSRRSRAGS